MVVAGRICLGSSPDNGGRPAPEGRRRDRSLAWRPLNGSGRAPCWRGKIKFFTSFEKGECSYFTLVNTILRDLAVCRIFSPFFVPKYVALHFTRFLIAISQMGTNVITVYK